MGDGLRVCWLVAVLALVSCGDDSGGQDGTAGAPVSGPVSEQEFWDRYGTLACEGLEVCCEQAGIGYNAAVCQLFVGSAGGQSTVNATYDPDAAADCLNEVQSADIVCEGGLDTPACGRVYVGTLEPGAACSADAECAKPEVGGAECDVFDEVCVVSRRGDEGDACNRTCEDLDTGGWVCSGTVSGDLPAFTDVECYINDGLSCQAGVCVALSGPGEACSFDGDCAPGNRCDGAGACVALLPLGAACQSSDECNPEAHCAGSESCEADRAEGEPCSADAECLGGACDGNVCGPDDALGGLADFSLALLCGGG